MSGVTNVSQRLLWAGFLVGLLVVATPGQVHLAATLTAGPGSASGVIGEAHLNLDLDTNSLRFRVVTTCVAPASCYYLQLTGGAASGFLGASTTLSVVCGYGLGLVAPEMYEGIYNNVPSAVVASLINGECTLVIGTGFQNFGIVTPIVQGRVLHSTRRRFEGTLSSAGVAGSTSAATGIARVTLEEVERRVLYDIDTTGLSGVLANLWMVGTSGPPTLITSLSGGGSRFAGRSELLSVAALDALRAGRGFITINSLAAPQGEIGGALTEPTTVSYVARLKGDYFSATNPTSATGFARISINNLTRVATYEITASGLFGQEARVMLTIPRQTPVFWVSVPAVSANTWQLTTPPQTPAEIETLRQGLISVVVTDAANTDGIIGGQLLPTEYNYGYGSETGAGIAQIAHRGEHRLGNPDWAALLFNAPPQVPVYLAIAFANESFGGNPLPVDLGTGGAFSSRAFMWIDASTALFLPTGTDAAGSAVAPLPLTFPLSAYPALTGLEGYYQWLILAGVAPITFSVSDALKLVLH